MIEIITAGLLTTIQDLGRPGRATQGIGHSGAADRPSLRLANRLAGNPESAAALEITLGGLRVRFVSGSWFAVSGAPCRLELANRQVGMDGPVYARPGDTLRVDAPSIGLRTYLAIAGGITVPPVAGSRSTDQLSGIGPGVLHDGASLPIGRAHPPPPVDHAPQPALEPAPVLRVIPGPRDDWFTPAALRTLYTSEFHVSPDSNRVALRLTGPRLERRHDRELPSEPLVCGALQVPGDGQPVLFLADHPVTGGYPVIGVVPDAGVARAAQARPGDTLRFRPHERP